MTNDDAISTSTLKLIVSIGSLFLKAAVANTLWAWHLSPVVGVAAPGVWRCTGLVVLVSLVFHQYSPPEKADATFYWYLVVGPLFALLFGWICK